MQKSHEHNLPSKAERIKSAKYDIQVADKLRDDAMKRYLMLTGWLNYGSFPEGIWIHPGYHTHNGVTIEEAVDIQWERDSS